MRDEATILLDSGQMAYAVASLCWSMGDTEASADWIRRAADAFASMEASQRRGLDVLVSA